jgi:cell division protein FtsL
MKTLVALAVMSLLLLYVWERVEVVRVGYQIERLKTQKVSLQRERDELQVKVSALTSPERIARIAKDQLGMTPPQPGQVVLVRLEVPTQPGSAAQSELRLAKRDGVEITR